MTQAPSIEKLDKNFTPAEVADGLHWYDIRDLGVEGKGFSDSDRFYDRLPARAKGVVHEHVWELSHHSTGICVRFVTDAPTISARWTLFRNSLAMSHMPASGVSGLDLYAKVKGKWVWAGVGIPENFPSNTAQLAGNLAPGKREYLLYCPLYNGVESVSIGLPPEATLARAPRRTGKRAKGVIVYGTSIVHGGCACRSGMGYPEIMGRALDCHVVNLGFSGNGPMHLEMAPFLAELDPAVYVLDGLPNMSAEMVKERAEKFVGILRQARPKTPIVLVENIQYQRHLVQRPGTSGHEQKNVELRAAYKRMLKAGVKGLSYVPCTNLLGSDTLGTVDGTHPTDVGFMRLAAAIGSVVKKLM